MHGTAPANVLYVDNTFTFGGAINALGYLLAAIDRDAVTPIVLSAQPQADLSERFRGMAAEHWPAQVPWMRDGVPVVGPEGSSLGSRASNKVRALRRLGFYEFPEAIRFARLARKRNVSLIHLNNGVEGLLPPLFAAKLLGVPVVAHARGSTGTAGMARVYAGLPDRWIAVSGSIARNLSNAGVPPEKIRVIHDAIDLSSFETARPSAPLRHELGLSPEDRVFAVFGRLIDWKGIREFVIAARDVIEAVPGARALVVGDPSDGDPAYVREVAKLAADLGIGDRVLFTGFRSDVPDVMALCDVIVHSSIVPEPFGMTVIEGMATGVPVVAADSGGPTEIVEHGVTGLLADPRDPPALAREIVRLLLDQALAQRIAEAGARRARTHYSAERYAADVMRLYAELGVADPRSRGARPPLPGPPTPTASS